MKITTLILILFFLSGCYKADSEEPVTEVRHMTGYEFHANRRQPVPPPCGYW